MNIKVAIVIGDSVWDTKCVKLPLGAHKIKGIINSLYPFEI